MNGTWPRKGLCAFWGSGLHPTSTLIVWLAAVLGTQFLGYLGLVMICAAALFSAPGAFRRCLAYVRRARWLLLTLWLILAFNTPGEAMGDLGWAPTYEGVAEANLQAVRLVAMLACLAWVFARLGHDGMVAGLWGILQPFRKLGLDTERLVVRLSLVLENLQTPPVKGAWKQMLAADFSPGEGREILHLQVASWAVRDTVLVVACAMGLMGVVLL